MTKFESKHISEELKLEFSALILLMNAAVSASVHCRVASRRSSDVTTYTLPGPKLCVLKSKSIEHEVGW